MMAMIITDFDGMHLSENCFLPSGTGDHMTFFFTLERLLICNYQGDPYLLKTVSIVSLSAFFKIQVRHD